VNMSVLKLRRGEVADAPECGRIAYESFLAIADHHRFPPDFPSAAVATTLMEQLLSRGDVHAIVAEQAGNIAGSNFLWHGDDVAGVGPITVSLSFQNVGIGRALMKAVLAFAERRRQVGVRLVQAAYHNRSLSLYTKLGFNVCEPLSMLQGAIPKAKIEGREVRRAVVGDLEACDELARRVLGVSRHNEVMLSIMAGRATIVSRDGRISGYATSIGFFGHAVADQNEDLQALIGGAESIEGPGLLLPTRNAETLRWCLTHGLRVVQPLTLMSLGAWREPTGAWCPSILY